MKEIPMTGGLVALVDDEDYDLVRTYSWCRNGSKSQAIYAQTRSRRRGLTMHRLILNAPHGMQVDHINGNGLDNRKENLRLCTNRENHYGLPKPRSANGSRPTSTFKGVSWDRAAQRWAAFIGIDGRVRRLGKFLAEVDAALAYNAAALKAWGDWARLNDCGSAHDGSRAL